MPATSPTADATDPTTADLIRQRLAEGLSAGDIARGVGVTPDVIRDVLRTGEHHPFIHKRLTQPLRRPEAASREDRLLAAGERLAGAVRRAFVALPENAATHTHPFGMAEVCCRMTTDAVTIAARADVESALTNWHYARNRR